MPVFNIYVFCPRPNLWCLCQLQCTLLSSKTLQRTLGCHSFIGTPLSRNSFTNPIKGMADLKPSLKALNFTLVVLKATSGCNFDAQAIGQPAKVIMKRVLDIAVDESMCAVFRDQISLKSASHHLIVLWACKLCLYYLATEGQCISPLHFLVKLRFVQYLLC